MAKIHQAAAAGGALTIHGPGSQIRGAATVQQATVAEVVVADEPPAAAVGGTIQPQYQMQQPEMYGVGQTSQQQQQQQQQQPPSGFPQQVEKRPSHPLLAVLRYFTSNHDRFCSMSVCGAAGVCGGGWGGRWAIGVSRDRRGGRGVGVVRRAVRAGVVRLVDGHDEEHAGQAQGPGREPLLDRPLPFLDRPLPFLELSLPLLGRSLPLLDLSLPFRDLSLPVQCISTAFP